MMNGSDSLYYNEMTELASREEIADLQWNKLKTLLEIVFARNLFYIKKYSDTGVSLHDIKSLEDLQKLPFTTKKNFQDDQEQNPIYGTNLSEPLENYVQYHQTTGTTGKPLKWLDTRESWQWRAHCIAHAFKASGVTKKATLFLPFGFGPYTAFWGAYEAAQHLGLLTIPGGGWSTVQRLHSIVENKATIIATTTTYALRMLEVALEEGIDLPGSDVKLIILAGEPGAQVPAIREKIEVGWGGSVYDYPGLTETGTYAFMCSENPQAQHVIESEFIIEVINPENEEHVGEGKIGELVLTNLGRTASPAIRFKTGDLVKLRESSCKCGRTFSVLDGGILGRKDEMLIVRGVNVYPVAISSVIENYLLPGNEYQIIVERKEEQDELEIQIELGSEQDGIEEQIIAEFKKIFNLRIKVKKVIVGAIERSEYKSKRFLDKRKKHN